uniref:Uncharacterized protein n=1 Tax=Caenorhabditis tropicalis TaxID=1561998 RepID=A0A1I7U3G1_9PELO
MGGHKWLIRSAFLVSTFLICITIAQELLPSIEVESLAQDLQIQEWMRTLRRVKRAPTRSESIISVLHEKEI